MTEKEWLELPTTAKDFVRELGELLAAETVVKVEMNVSMAVTLVSQIQLALRHPDNKGPMVEQLVKPFLAQLIQKVGTKPTIKRVLLAGNNPACDFLIFGDQAHGEEETGEETLVPDDRRRNLGGERGGPPRQCPKG
jgi:hypothetical protein